MATPCLEGDPVHDINLSRSTQKPFGSSAVHLGSVATSALLTNFLATMSVELLAPAMGTGRKLSVREDVVWRGLLYMARRLDACTDLEVAYIVISKVA